MTYTRLEYGSKGNDVKKLQNTLNNKGYNLEVDGSYGAKTQAAVKDYQSKNNLAVDGVAGNNTWSSLLGSSTSSSGAGYTPSSTVQAAQAKLNQAEASKPGAYVSQNNEKIQQLLEKVINPTQFSYNPNNDSVFKHYRDQYTTNGQKAMEDTIGKAASLSGGYGNSYAQTAGQQVYNQYMGELAAKIPELEQIAYNRYQNELASKQNALNTLLDVENIDYSRYQDILNQYYENRNYYNNQYNAEKDFDYSKYVDDRNYAYQLDRDEIEDQRYDNEIAYQKERDAVSDNHWEREFEASTSDNTDSAESVQEWSGNSYGPDYKPAYLDQAMSIYNEPVYNSRGNLMPNSHNAEAFYDYIEKLLAAKVSDETCAYIIKKVTGKKPSEIYRYQY